MRSKKLPVALFLFLGMNLLTLTFGPVTSTAADTRWYFRETRQSLEGKFFDYWQKNGGLKNFGFPLTPQFYENGFLVQYFERNRFELHPENRGTRYEVLLGLLGRERLTAENRSVKPGGTPQPGAQYFPPTGYSAGGSFLQYWQKNGGLEIFGYPITPEIKDGNLTVQYFERTRFELHPEYTGTSYLVLLTLLGTERAQNLDPVLRKPWAEPLPSVKLSVSASGSLKPLTPVTVNSDTAGTLHLLGGDNRRYASYSLKAKEPLTFYLVGQAGSQSLLLEQNGQLIAARWSAFELAKPETAIESGDPVWDGFYPIVKNLLRQNLVVYNSPVDERPVPGYRSSDTPFIWLRDHIYQSKGFKYYEPQMKEALDYFRQTQHADGSLEDYFQHFTGFEVYAGQIEVEADREYLYVQGVWLVWQATGDDNWLRLNLAPMERALNYTFTDPKRWSSEYGLVKRAFTIDTWDFEQGTDVTTIRRYLDANTRWSIMHGDNTGTYQSARLLAQIERYFGRPDQAAFWDNRADTLLANLNRVSWNGNFYTHQVHLTPVDPTGVDESTQLSLSNAYALNRGTLTQDQAAALIRTYQSRRTQNGSRSFAEWYSIDPPFQKGFGTAGEYVNGGIMPLVGGELARGAFDHGFEDYGLDILRRYRQLLDKTGGSYLWYYPDGRPGIITTATLNTDGWGSAAMLSALIEGLGGVVDTGKLYRQVNLAPRWAATDRTSVGITATYGASGTYFSYRWQKLPGSLGLTWGGAQTERVNLHLLLPTSFSAPGQLLVNGVATPFTLSKVENSYYLDATLPGSGRLEIK